MWLGYIGRVTDISEQYGVYRGDCDKYGGEGISERSV